MTAVPNVGEDIVMRGPRFTIRALLLVTAIVAVCLVSWKEYRAWYFQNHPMEYMRSQLYTAVRDGNSVDEVSVLLGAKGTREPPPDSVRQIYGQRTLGVTPADDFLVFSRKDRPGRKPQAWLQFRDGYLVNHIPKQFAP